LDLDPKWVRAINNNRAGIHNFLIKRKWTLNRTDQKWDNVPFFDSVIFVS